MEEDKPHDWHKAANKKRDEIFRKLLGLERKEEPPKKKEKEEELKEDEDFEIPELELDEPDELKVDTTDPFNMGDMFDEF